MVVSGRQISVSEGLVQALVALGVEEAFGILGGAIAPFCLELARSTIRLTHFRHEAGAAFAAIECSLATGRPVVVFSTTGPGVTNLLTGMAAARWEGAKVVFVSGCTPASLRGRWAFQETSAYTMGMSDLFAAGALFHHAAVIEDAVELEVTASRLAVGMTRPNGFVAHVGLPLSVQGATATAPPRPRFSSLRPPACSPDSVATCVEVLRTDPFVVWAGFGARNSAPAVRALAERTGARVMCTPRGKGIIPEDHPLYIGVTGLGGSDAPMHYIRMARPARALVLGSRLGEFSSFYSEELVPREGFVQVDLDPTAFGAAYPSVSTLGVNAEIGAFLDALLAAWPEGARHWPLGQVADLTLPRLVARPAGPVRPSYLMSTVQRVIVDETDATIITEAGNAFALGSHYLRFRSPNRYRVSTGFGSMGHATAGVVGAAIGRDHKAVAIVGDGAMLMLNELTTAVACDADAVWIVLNDARYGMIAQGMEALGWEPFATEFPRADFAGIAEALGARAARVEHEEALETALRAAMSARGPFVVDVAIDPSEAVPSGKRNASLTKQRRRSNPPPRF
jgi:acetolactate synthase-1/2/3 large subunit